MNPEIIVTIKNADDVLLECVMSVCLSTARKAVKAGRAVPSIRIYPEIGPAPIEICQMPGGIMLLDPAGEEKKK